jgi:serine phosphatase RsbU (regulator of sigma subunit)
VYNGSLARAPDRRVFVRRRPVGRSLRFACAGYPPPLVFASAGGARLEWGGRSLPLDALRTPRPRDEALIVIPEAGGVVLYSDGLVERRSRPLSDGLDALATVVGRQFDDASAFAQTITTALRAPRGR